MTLRGGVLRETTPCMASNDLTLSQTTNFLPFQTESLQTTVLNLIKMAECSF